MNDSLELPTDVLRKAAFERFGETNESRVMKLNELQKLVLNSPICQGFDTSHGYLIRYLRGRQFNVLDAFNCIKSTMEFREKYPNWTSNLTADEMSIFKSVAHILPVRANDGRLVVLSKMSHFFNAWKPEMFEKYQCGCIRMNLFVNEYFSKNYDAQVYGVLTIGSFSDMTNYQTRTMVAAVAPFHERLAFSQFQSYCSAFKNGKCLSVY